MACDEIKVQQLRLEDGRYAERHIKETDNEIVTELHVEPIRDKYLSERVTEKIKPVVYERSVEKVDASGLITERRVESLDPSERMQTVEHIGLANSVSAQSFNTGDCYVTKEDLSQMASEIASQTREGILAAAKAIKGNVAAATTGVSAQSKYKVAMQSATPLDNIENPLGWIIIAGLLGVLFYVYFFM